MLIRSCQSQTSISAEFCILLVALPLVCLMSHSFTSTSLHHSPHRLRSTSSSSSAGGSVAINSSPIVSLDVIEELRITDQNNSSAGGLMSLKRDVKVKTTQNAPSVISCRPLFYPSPSGAYQYHTSYLCHFICLFRYIIFHQHVMHV